MTKIKGNREKQVEVYKLFRTVMQECDPDAFEEMFDVAVSTLKNDPSTSDFGEYFEKEYSRTKKCWAYCYRLHAGLNTNMHLERMHGIIKHLYLKGNKPKRLDVALHALLRFLRDKIFDKLISFHRGKCTAKISAIRKRHKTSLEMDANNIIQGDNCDQWQVLSSDGSGIYTVTKVDRATPCDNCPLKCVECKMCIHEFICTCPDSAIKSHMCKHIHLIRRQLVHQEETVLQVDKNDEIEDRVLIIEDEPIGSRLQETLINDLQMTDESKGDAKAKRSKDLFASEVKHALEEANSEEDWEVLRQAVAQARATIRAKKGLQQTSVFVAREEHSKKTQKFEPQRQFVTTKKTREKPSTTSLVAPTAEERQEIALSLLSENRIAFSSEPNC